MQFPQITISVSFDKKVKKSELVNVTCSEDTANLLRKIFSADTFDWTEEMILLCLNRKSKVLGYYKVSSGGITATMCDPKVIFTVALQATATSIIIAHNHPSGDAKPGMADKELTAKIKAAGALLDITLLDHIILTDESYYSFADMGEL